MDDINYHIFWKVKMNSCSLKLSMVSKVSSEDSPQCSKNSRGWPPPNPRRKIQSHIKNKTNLTINTDFIRYEGGGESFVNEWWSGYLEGSESQVEEYFINFSDGLIEKDHVVDPEQRDEQQRGFGQPPENKKNVRGWRVSCCINCLLWHAWPFSNQLDSWSH